MNGEAVLAHKRRVYGETVALWIQTIDIVLYCKILPLGDVICMMYTLNFLVSLNPVLKSRKLCFVLHYYNFGFCIVLA